MFELIEVNPETGEEDSLIDTGTMAELSEWVREAVQELDEAGQDINQSPYRIQPAA